MGESHVACHGLSPPLGIQPLTPLKFERPERMIIRVIPLLALLSAWRKGYVTMLGGKW